MNLITDTEVAAILSIAVDANLSRIVAAVEDDFRRATGRTFERKARTEYLAGYGPRVDFVFLREAPIATVNEVRIDPTGTLDASTAETDLTLFVFDSDTDDFRLRYVGGWFPEGPRTVMVTYTAGYYEASDPDTSHLPKLPNDLRDGLIEEAIARYRRGTDEQFQSVSVSGVESFTRGKLGTTTQFDRMVARYRRVA